MALSIVTKSEELVVGVLEFKNHARIDTNDEDALIQSMIQAVTAWLAGPQGWLGRSLLEQTLALSVPLDDLMTGVVLPRPPVIEVQSVSVVDKTGTATTIAATGYATHDQSDGLTALLFTPEFRVPLIAPGPAWLRIQYRAGYGPNGSDVDPGIRHAMMMAVMRLYAGRGDPTMTLASDPMMADLFATYRVWTLA